MWPSPPSPPPLEYLPPPPPTLSLRVQFLPKCQTRHTGNNRFPQRIHHCSHCIHHCIYDYYLDHRRSHYNDYLDHLYHTVTTSSRDKCSMKPNNINNLGRLSMLESISYLTASPLVRLWKFPDLISNWWTKRLPSSINR